MPVNVPVPVIAVVPGLPVNDVRLPEKYVEETLDLDPSEGMLKNSPLSRALLSPLLIPVLGGGVKNVLLPTLDLLLAVSDPPPKSLITFPMMPLPPELSLNSSSMSAIELDRRRERPRVNGLMARGSPG